MSNTKFTPQQIESINTYQKSGVFHPFTCSCGEDFVAHADALHCPKCGATQDWVHEFMANWAWLPPEDTLHWRRWERTVNEHGVSRADEIRAARDASR
jgi:ribosomal protein S27AE